MIPDRAPTSSTRSPRTVAGWTLRSGPSTGGRGFERGPRRCAAIPRVDLDEVFPRDGPEVGRLLLLRRRQQQRLEHRPAVGGVDLLEDLPRRQFRGRLADLLELLEQLARPRQVLGLPGGLALGERPLHLPQPLLLVRPALDLQLERRRAPPARSRTRPWRRPPSVTRSARPGLGGEPRLDAAAPWRRPPRPSGASARSARTRRPRSGGCASRAGPRPASGVRSGRTGRGRWR